MRQDKNQFVSSRSFANTHPPSALLGKLKVGRDTVWTLARGVELADGIGRAVTGILIKSVISIPINLRKQGVKGAEQWSDLQPSVCSHHRPAIPEHQSWGWWYMRRCRACTDRWWSQRCSGTSWPGELVGEDGVEEPVLEVCLHATGFHAASHQREKSGHRMACLLTGRGLPYGWMEESNYHDAFHRREESNPRAAFH